MYKAVAANGRVLMFHVAKGGSIRDALQDTLDHQMIAREALGMPKYVERVVVAPTSINRHYAITWGTIDYILVDVERVEA